MLPPRPLFHSRQRRVRRLKSGDQASEWNSRRGRLPQGALSSIARATSCTSPFSKLDRFPVEQGQGCQPLPPLLPTGDPLRSLCHACHLLTLEHTEAPSPPPSLPACATPHATRAPACHPSRVWSGEGLGRIPCPSPAPGPPSPALSTRCTNLSHTLGTCSVLRDDVLYVDSDRPKGRDRRAKGWGQCGEVVCAK